MITTGSHDEKKDSPTTVHSDDWLPERGRLETSVSREFLPTENRRKCSRSFASKFAEHRPENEFAFSSVRCRSLTLNSGVARTRLGRRIPSDELKSSRVARPILSTYLGA